MPTVGPGDYAEEHAGRRSTQRPVGCRAEPRSLRETPLRKSPAQQRRGSVLLTAGGVLGMLVAADVASGGAFTPLGRTVPLPLWGLLAAVLLAVGWLLLRTRQAGRWEPAYPGRRFRRLVVYTRENCPLCDEAIALLQEHAEWLPPIETVDVDSDVTLQRRFGTEVPVVEIDGRVRFRGRISRVLLRRLIIATPPLAAEERERTEMP